MATAQLINSSALNNSSLTEHKPSVAKIAAKALLVAVVIAGLATALFFGVGALASLVGVGAAAWKIGLVTVAVIATSVSLLGTGFFATKHEMFEDTDDNLADAGRFIRDTFGCGFYAMMYGVEAVKEWQIWNMITKQ